MPEYQHRIICASAGTGKTYRLSLEYIALLLTYYDQPEFKTDNILALTFTRKATAEIRDRILEQLNLLLNNSVESARERQNLLDNLRVLVPGESFELSLREANLLSSAMREIACDKSRLQVMTIDAYVSNIFRNIVRPLRNIESFEIDTQAIDKRMPFLLNHLMQPEFRHRLNKLLTRKVNRSLDSYAAFFASLIRSRWLFYMITQRLESKAAEPFSRVRDLDKADALGSKQHETALRDTFTQALHLLLETVNGICTATGKNVLEDYFKTDFKALLSGNSISVAAMLQKLLSLADDPANAEKLLNVLAKDNIWSGTKISKRKYEAETIAMETAQQQALRALADYLMRSLYINEQNEIIELWKIILAEYDRLIYRYKNMTYDDISWFSFEALFSEDPPFFDAKSEASATEFYQFLSHRTRFLLIDEFQDTSLIQFNILKPIIEEITSGEGSKPFGGLIVVGDEKQSIFGWRGGQRDLLLNMNKIFPSLGEIQPERLDSCWRCGPTLMHFVNQLFQSPGIHNYLADKQMSWSYQMIRGQGARYEPDTQIEFCLRNYSRSAKGLMRGEEVYADFVNRMVVPALQEDPTGSIAILCRKGSELIQVQQALDDCKISSLYQPDRSICLHSLISPLLDWLRYVAWGDWCDLLGFLRSDYLRIKPALLKATLDTIAASEALSRSNKAWQACDFSALPLVEQMQKLAEQQRAYSVYQICRELTELCLGEGQNSERDYLNLHRFMGIIADWELNQSSGAASIPDFLAYLNENMASEDFKQASIAAGDSLQLLTIHKSKGLEFKRVFVFYNLSSGHREDSATLSWALQYAGEDFHEVRDFGISFHYQKILKASSYAHLWEGERRRELLEEMNNLYVAFTRAQNKLHLYFCYEGKDPWPDYLASRTDISLPALLCDACMQTLQDLEPDSRGILRLNGMFQTEKNKDDPQADSDKLVPQEEQVLPDYSALLANIPFSKTPSSEFLQKNDNPAHLNWKQVWLKDRPNLMGDLAHYYLSFIHRNLDSEHAYALRRCFARYGSLVSQEEIVKLVDVCKVSCCGNPWLFDPTWDKVFTEFEIKGMGSLQRLDRLMLNTKDKQAIIVDYKSGGLYDDLQLENYRATLSGLPILQGYSLETKFVYLNR